MNGLICLTILGVLFSAGTSMYVSKARIRMCSNGYTDENTSNDNGDTANSDSRTGEGEPQIIIDTWSQDLIDSIDFENRTRALENLAANNRRKRFTSCSKAGVLKIKAYYDDAFVSRFGTNADAEARIQAIFELMQVFLEHSSLSVNVRGVVIDSFTIDLVEVIHLSGRTIRASSAGLSTFRNYIDDEVWNGVLRQDIQSYMLFSNQNDQAGTVGIAYLETTCSCSLQYRTSLTEYFVSDAVTAETAVHELGHNLGAYHDFDGSPGTPKYDSNGNLCTDIGGVMDYYQTATTWSPCSNEDIGNYFSGLQSLCFPIEDSCSTITAGPTPTSTSATTPTSTSTATPMPTEPNGPACSCAMRSNRKRRKCCKAAFNAGLCCDGCGRCSY